MSFLHSEQPKCNKIFPHFQSRKCHFPTFSPSSTMSLRTQSAPFFFNCPGKCEMSPFPPVSGTSPFPLCVCTGKDLQAWPGFLCGSRPGLATISRAQGLAPVFSSLRTDQKSFALLCFHSHVWQLISQYQ